MIEEIYKNIYRIRIELKGSPLKELNTFLIRSEGKEVLIDAGYRTWDCRSQMNDALYRLGCNRENLTVALTHMHSDHAALSPVIAGKTGEILIGAKDLEFGRRFFYGDLHKDLRQRMLADGLPREECINRDAAEVEAPNFGDPRFRGLADGELIRVGEYQIQLIDVPGHTPGNAMFWMEEQGILFTGDHILYDISPNITAFPGCGDLLGQYLESLKKADRIPEKKAYPAHRGIEGDYHGRISELLDHHEKRLLEVETIVRNYPGSMPYEIAAQMKWRIRAGNWKTFPKIQKWFAMGECQAHLDHLEICGRIQKDKNDTRFNRYTPV